MHAATCALLLAAPNGGSAQLRRPAVEVYGVANASHWGDEGWRPEVGASILAPLGRRWGVLWDVTAGWARETFHSPFIANLNGRVAGEEQRSSGLTRLSLMPSVVRLWRQERFSVYAGAGLSYWISWERWRYRVLAEAPDDVLRRLGDGHTGSYWKTAFLLNFQVGALLSLSPRVVVRAGWRQEFHPETPRRLPTLGVGIGYRFGN